MTPFYAPDFNDSAFEPNSGYVFDESSTMEQFRRGLNGPYDGNMMDMDQSPDSAMMAWGDQMGMSSNDHQQGFPSQSLAPRGFPYPSPITPSWQQQSTASMPQSQPPVTDNRDSATAQRYGQVTPVTSQSRSPVSGADDPQKNKSRQSQQTAQSHAKSERARNAANHRHSQSKQARESVRRKRRSTSPGDNNGDKEGEGEEGDKPSGVNKQEYREKNRQAAAKCRRKKKDSTEILQTAAREGAEKHARLKAQVRQLRDEFSGLRTMALAHDGCQCTAIHQYNAGQAQQAVRGQAGLQDLHLMQSYQGPWQAMPSMQMQMQPRPSMQSTVDGNMSTPEMATMSPGSLSRAPSFSTEVRPDMAMHLAQRDRTDSKHSTMQHKPALHLDGSDFAFEQALEPFPEDGRNGEYQ